MLLVEDDPADALLIRTMLSEVERTARMDHVTTLAAAKEALATHAHQVVLLDLNLPDSEGLGTLLELAEEEMEIPVLVLTGLDDRDLGKQAVEGRAQDFLVKGEVNADQLLRAIHHGIRRHRRERELERAASIDPLTGLLNRRGLERELPAAVSREAREKGGLVALLVDCDDFKSINETYGLEAGDAVLQAVAGALRDSVRPSDHVARPGGDEFVVLLPDTRTGEARLVAERIRDGVSRLQVALEGKEIPVTVSVGVARLGENALDVAEIFRAARAALGDSKHGGKNRVSDGGPTGRLHPTLSDRELAARLSEGRGFSARAEPIVSLADGRPSGVEIRVRGPVGICEAPADLLRMARTLNILTTVDLRSFETCAREAGGRGTRDRIHLNLLPSTIIEAGGEVLLGILESHLPTARVCIEISERELIGDAAPVSAALRPLRDAGAVVAIDEVGFGRSSLESLLVLEPDIAKIDRRFVSRAHADGGRRRSLERLLRAVAALGCEAIAEGVESREEVDLLLEIGVPFGQGGYWSLGAQGRAEAAQ